MMEHPVLPLSLIQRVSATREQFISTQHFEAWKLAMPLRRHLEHKKKFTRDERDRFRAHHHYKCSFCPASVLLTLDHIVPQVLGGSSLDVNLRYACSACNVRQWRPYDAYLRLYDQFLASVAA